MAETNEYREQRVKNMQALAEAGYTPFGMRYDHTELAQVRQDFVEGATARVAGRLLMIRRTARSTL